MKRLDSFKGVTLKVEELHEVEGGFPPIAIPIAIALYLLSSIYSKSILKDDFLTKVTSKNMR